MAPKELNFITGNKNKLAEVQAILSAMPIKLQSQNVDLVEIQGTIEEISTDKARRAAEAVRAVTGGMYESCGLMRKIGQRTSTGGRHMPLLHGVR